MCIHQGQIQGSRGGGGGDVLPPFLGSSSLGYRSLQMPNPSGNSNRNDGGMDVNFGSQMSPSAQVSAFEQNSCACLTPFSVDVHVGSPYTVDNSIANIKRGVMS